MLTPSREITENSSIPSYKLKNQKTTTPVLKELEESREDNFLNTVYTADTGYVASSLITTGFSQH